jgi:hypothetical protein
MTVPGEQETRRPPHRLALSFWLLGTIATGGVLWLFYGLTAELEAACFGVLHGGRTAGESWAALPGLVLLLVAAILAFRWRRRLLLLFAAFASVYIAYLLAQWYWLSAAIWGHARCT